MKSEQLKSSTSSLSTTLLLQFSESEIQTRMTPSGLVVELEGCRYPGEPGGPALPVKLVRVALPIGATDPHVEAKAVRTVPIANEPTLVAPIQPPRPMRSGVPADPIKKSTLRAREMPFVEPMPPQAFVPHRAELYTAAVERPLARFIAMEEIAAAPMAVIEISPVRVNPKGTIDFVPDIELTVTFQRITDQSDAGPRFTRAFHSRAQAERQMELARSLVLNPAEIMDITGYLPAFLVSVDYLVITDNVAWDAQTVQPKATHGDLVSVFKRLTDWKRSRGLNSKVVTVSEIVNGTYGDFVTGSRDLQEIIRNFLKWAHQTWGVAWVVLGGDVDTIPVRLVAGAALGDIYLQTTDPPPDNCSFWTGTYLKMKMNNPGVWWPGNYADQRLLRSDTGALIPYDAAGVSSPTSPGWYFTTDNTYSVRTTTPTNFVKVNGPAAVVDGPMRWMYDWNTIPTDFYYASLIGPDYSVAGKHDWDKVDNGIYGQQTDSVNLDGVSWYADVSVGRVPVSTEAETIAFVNKLIAYEQFRRPDGTPLETTWPRRMLMVSTNFSSERTSINASSITPPADDHFYHAAGANSTLIHLGTAPTQLDWNLIAQVTPADLRLLPFTTSAASAGRGWYFAKSATDLTPNEITINIFGATIKKAVPSAWVAVYGPAAELAPQQFIWDNGQPDGSVAGEESCRKQMQTELPQISLVSRLYEDDCDVDPPPPALDHLTQQRLRTALNDGQHIVCLEGHGSSNGCCWLDSAMARSLTNGFNTFIAYANSCLTNQFDYEDAMGEYLITNPNGGAVAYVGNTRFGWIGLGDDFQKAFVHRLVSSRHVGLLNDSRCALVASSGWALYKWTLFTQNLLGDPEMPVWLGSPARLRAEFTSALDRRVPLKISVVSPLSGTPLMIPVTGATVHIRQGNFERVANTGTTNFATFDINPTQLGDLEITISKEGYIPYFGSARIAGPAWVHGGVTYIEHRRQAGDTYVRLHLDPAVEKDADRGWWIRRADSDFDALIDAVTDAYTSAKPVSLFVNLLDEGATAERFLFGVWTEPIKGVIDVKARLVPAPAHTLMAETEEEKVKADRVLAVVVE